MDDESHPVAMGSGLLIGMGLGLVIAAGTLAWRNATATLCTLAALEADRVTVENCPPQAVRDPLAAARFEVPLWVSKPLNRR